MPAWRPAPKDRPVLRLTAEAEANALGIASARIDVQTAFRPDTLTMEASTEEARILEVLLNEDVVVFRTSDRVTPAGFSASPLCHLLRGRRLQPGATLTVRASMPACVPPHRLTVKLVGRRA